MKMSTTKYIKPLKQISEWTPEIVTEWLFKSIPFMNISKYYHVFISNNLYFLILNLYK